MCNINILQILLMNQKDYPLYKVVSTDVMSSILDLNN